MILVLIIAESKMKDLLFTMDTMLVVSLVGKDVFGYKSLQCIINDYNSLDKVRKNIKDVYDIEFEEFPRYADWGAKLDNITDNRDISLYI